ncbi:RimK/LysX family protein [Pelagicoccus sp. SDUM812003]|uniref:ATP-dependent zinc protease family protein n=1 Tax=Pelagicoccus sp. SDUM812003 TaxID=3041267 RepID=UPI00280E6926|nr:RimK/LysX family protein [Pelagicoccus sp. SDUM812003]MDQ8201906.1 RimK/LysX family protein [Pelagicoccus sp. SDUM812003]
MSKDHPTTIGWKESIDLPEWGIIDITAKADTGARRSAIDVERIVELPDGRVQFDVAADRRTGQLRRTIVADIAHQTHVRSSNGQQHERYFVTTSVRVGDVTKEIELSLSNRRHMQCRMLLGRKALEEDFLVDCSSSFLTRPNRKPKLKRG